MNSTVHYSIKLYYYKHERDNNSAGILFVVSVGVNSLHLTVCICKSSVSISHLCGVVE